MRRFRSSLSLRAGRARKSITGLVLSKRKATRSRKAMNWKLDLKEFAEMWDRYAVKKLPPKAVKAIFNYINVRDSNVELDADLIKLLSEQINLIKDYYTFFNKSHGESFADEKEIFEYLEDMNVKVPAFFSDESMLIDENEFLIYDNDNSRQADYDFAIKNGGLRTAKKSRRSSGLRGRRHF